MILESGRIASIEAEGVWVETIRRSTCGSCRAEKGCGQSLMAKWGGQTSYLWVLLEGRDPADYRIGDEIQIGVPEEVVAKGSMLVYLLPLVVMMTVTWLTHNVFAQELLTTLGGLIGLLLGGLVVRWYSHHIRFDRRLQPVLVDEREPLNFCEPIG
jgi:sigma-E factor negative regulatory protein RseC